MPLYWEPDMACVEKTGFIRRMVPFSYHAIGVEGRGALWFHARILSPAP
jgi:hypothetical protein